MPTLLTPQLQSFAKLGRIIQSGVFDFAETIIDPSVLDDLQEVLEEQAGRLTRLYNVTLDGETFSGRAEKRISLGKTESYTFTMSPERIYFKPIVTADLAEYLESDRGWEEIVEYAATAKSRRADKELKCKPENYQCGGKCQSKKRGCPSNPTAEQKVKIEEAVGKAKGGKKPKADAKPKAEAEDKPSAEPKKVATPEAKPEKIDSYEKFETAALQTFRKLDEDFNMGGLVPIYRMRRELGDRVNREDFDKYIFDLQSKDRVELLEESVEDGAADKLADSVKTKFGKTRAYAKLTPEGKNFADKLEKADDIIEPKSGKKIKDYDSFAKEVEAAYDKYNKEFKAGNLVPIYQLRRAIGDRVSRQEFSDWLFKMQSNDVFEMLEESVEDSAPDKIEDSVTTKFGKLRCYVKKLK